MARARKPAPAIPSRPTRTEILVQALDVIALIRVEPMQQGEIAKVLAIPIRTVNRVIRALDGARPQLDLSCEVRGQERYYSLPADTLTRALPRGYRAL